MVSLIMLTYNRKKDLPRSLTCCLHQNFTDYEIILVNNASTDGSQLICQDYAERFEKIRYFSNDNSNISSGRNLGISKAMGDFILFVDDDDYFSSDLLSFLHGLAVKNHADCAICGSEKEVDGLVLPNATGEKEEVFSGKEAVFTLLQRQKFNAALPTKLLKRSLFAQIALDETSKYDDISFTYKLLADCDTVVYHPTSHYVFVRHGKNNSNFTTDDSLLTPPQLNTYFQAFDERTKYLTEKFPDMAHYYRYTEWSYLISMINKIVSGDLKQCAKELEFAKKKLLKNWEEFSNSEYLLDFEKEFLKKHF